MKHHLKEKYLWQKRSQHFSKLAIIKAFNRKIKECMLSKDKFDSMKAYNIRETAFTEITALGNVSRNDLATPGQVVESALDTKGGTTIPPVITIKSDKQL